jgi:hypothetical protein
MVVTITPDRLILDAGSYITTVMGSDILDVRTDQVQEGSTAYYRVRVVRRAGTDVYIDLRTATNPYRAWANNLAGAEQCVEDISAIAGVAPSGSTIIVIGGTEVSNFLWTTASLNLTNASMTLASNALSLSVHPPQTGFTTASTIGTDIVGTLGLNGLSLGVPAFVTNTGGGGGAITVSAGTLSGSRDSIVFSNSNGVTFGMSGSTITGSVQTNYAASNITSGRAGAGFTTVATVGSNVAGTLGTNGLNLAVPAFLTTAQSPGAYLTTAMQSGASTQFVQANATIAGTNVTGTIASNVISLSVAAQSADANKAGTGFTSTTTAGTNVAATLGTNGLSMAVPAFLTTAAQSNHSHAFATTTTTGSLIVVGTTNSNGATIGVPAYLTTAQSPGAYLTTAMASNRGSDFVQATAAFAGTNASGTIASSGISVSVAAQSADANKAGTGFTSASTAGTAVAATLGTNGLSMGIPAYITTATQSNQAFSASGGSSAFQTLVFANSNGLTFSNSNGSVIGSYTVPSTAGLLSAIQITAGTNSYLSSRISFRDGNGVSWIADPLGSVIASVRADYAGTGFVTTTAGGSVVAGTLNTTGMTLAVPAFLTTAAQSNHSHGNPTLALTNLSGTTASNSAGLTLSLSAAAPGGGGNVSFSAGTSSAALASLVFSNSNGVSFGLNGSTMTASVVAGGGGGAAISAGANSQNTGTVNFSYSNGVSFGLATNGVMTAFVDGLDPATQNTFENRQLGASSALAHGQNSLWLVPFRLNNALNASTMMQMFSFTGTGSSNNTGQVGATFRFALFKQTATASTARFDSIWSKSIIMTAFVSSSNSFFVNVGGDGPATTITSLSSAMYSNVWNVRMLTVPIGSTLNSGRYLMGYVVSTSNAGNSAGLRTVSPIVDRPMTMNLGNNFGSAIGASNGFVDAGVYSATTGAIPASVNLTQFSVSSNVVPFFKIGAL